MEERKSINYFSQDINNPTIIYIKNDKLNTIINKLNNYMLDNFGEITIIDKVDVTDNNIVLTYSNDIFIGYVKFEKYIKYKKINDDYI